MNGNSSETLSTFSSSTGLSGDSGFAVSCANSTSGGTHTDESEQKKKQWLANKRMLFKLIDRVVENSEKVEIVELHPLVFPPDGLRDVMFSMGADRAQIDHGFDDKQAMDAFFDQLQTGVHTFQREHDPDAKPPNGKPG